MKIRDYSSTVYNIKQKINNSSVENEVSLEELQLLTLNKLQEATEKLTSINEWLTFFGVLTIMSIVISLLILINNL